MPPKFPEKDAVAKLRLMAQKRKISIKISPERLEMYKDLSHAYSGPKISPIIWINIVVCILSFTVGVLVGVLK